MNSISIGSQNTNLYFNVILNEEIKNKNESTRCPPLDALPIQNQMNKRRLSFKVLS